MKGPNSGENLLWKVVSITGYYGGLRGAELVNLTWNQFKESDECWKVTFKPVKIRSGENAQPNNFFFIPKTDTIPEEEVNPGYYIHLYYNQLGSPTDGRCWRQYRGNKWTKQVYNILD